MRCKARSAPMQTILAAMAERAPRARVVLLDEETLLARPVECWPVVDVLVAFHSRGYPLDKVAAYAARVRPVLVNDLHMQRVMLDRREVYAVLSAARVPQPDTVVCDRVRGDVARLVGDTLQVFPGCTAAANYTMRNTTMTTTTTTTTTTTMTTQTATTATATVPTAAGADAAAAAAETACPDDGPITTVVGSPSSESILSDISATTPTYTPGTTNAHYPMTCSSLAPRQAPSTAFVDHHSVPAVTATPGPPQRRRMRPAVITKPFVEKPVEADDHSVYVYYPERGVRQLFRKTKNQSSRFLPDATSVRSSGSYIYQKFHQPDGMVDIKVYAVAGKYIYAESRKAPTVDGRVERTSEGLEVRNAITLTDTELIMCKRVARAFGQFIVGFDMLRTGSDSYIIDVNGWSFVKGYGEFAVIAGRMLGDYIVERLAERGARSERDRDDSATSELSAREQVSSHHSRSRGP
jgi:Diphosphoinositol pentakisphosphate kinase 2 N-terminal domain